MFAHPRCTTVDSDHYGCSTLVMNYLFARGHEQIRFVGGPDFSIDSQFREAGWQDALASRRIEPVAALRGDWSARSGYEVGRRLAQDRAMTAVYVANDQMATGVIAALRDAGLRVPEDVSVVGVDDSLDPMVPTTSSRPSALTCGSAAAWCSSAPSPASPAASRRFASPAPSSSARRWPPGGRSLQLEHGLRLERDPRRPRRLRPTARRVGAFPTFERLKRWKSAHSAREGTVHGQSGGRQERLRDRRADAPSGRVRRALLRVRQPLDRLRALHACPPRHPHRALQLPRAPLGTDRAFRRDAAPVPARAGRLLPHHHRPLPLPAHRWRGLSAGVQHVGLPPRPGGRPVGEPHRRAHQHARDILPPRARAVPEEPSAVAREEDMPRPKTFQSACDWIEDNKGHDDFFLMVEAFDPHEPFDVPDEYMEMYGGEEGLDRDYFEIPLYKRVSDTDVTPEAKAYIQHRYKALVTMTDRWFGKLIDTLEANDMLDDTLVMVTTDHGYFLCGSTAYIDEYGGGPARCAVAGAGAPVPAAGAAVREPRRPSSRRRVPRPRQEGVRARPQAVGTPWAAAVQMRCGASSARSRYAAGRCAADHCGSGLECRGPMRHEADEPRADVLRDARHRAAAMWETPPRVNSRWRFLVRTGILRRER